MPQIGAAVPLTLNVPASIPNQLANGQVVAGLVLKNLSAFALQVSIGSSQLWIPPFMSEPLPQSQLGNVVVTPVNVGAPTGAGLNYVLPTYYAQGEQLPAASALPPGQAAASVPRVGINALVIASGHANDIVVVPAGPAGSTLTLYYVSWSIVPTSSTLGAAVAGLYAVGLQGSNSGVEIITGLALNVATVAGGLASDVQTLDAFAHPIIVGATGAGVGLSLIGLELPAGGAALVTGIVEYVITTS